MTTRALLKFSGRTFEFATVAFPDGLPTRPVLETDDLQAGGLDGILVVNNRYIWRPFPVRGTIDCSTMGLAQTVAEDLMGFRGRFAVTFATAVLGRNVEYINPQAMEITAIPRRALGVSGLGAIVEASVMLRPTRGS